MPSFSDGQHLTADIPGAAASQLICFFYSNGYHQKDADFTHWQSSPTDLQDV